MFRLWIVVFASTPFEACLSAIARCLESLDDVVGVAIVATREWKERIEILGKKLGECLGIEVRSYTDFPDPLVNPSGFSMYEARRYVEKIGSELGKDVALVVSSGSRLEVSIASLAMEPRAFIYVSFGWGPWQGAFYPYTPRPIEPMYILGEVKVRDRVDSDFVEKLAKALRDFLPKSMPKLREMVLEAQVEINKEILDPIAFPRKSRGACPRMTIRISCGSSSRSGSISESVTIVNVCDYREVVSKIGTLARNLRDKIDRELSIAYTSILREGSRCASVVSTILGISGLETLVVRDGSTLVEALPHIFSSRGEKVAIDTNVVYGGLHNQLYDKPDASKYLVYPACVELEIYRKLVESRDPSQVFEAYLGMLAHEELSSFPMTKDPQLHAIPCETALYVSRYVVATADRRAYERLLSKRSERAELLERVSTMKAIATSYELKKASYAYYAIAQLKAIEKILNKLPEELGVKQKPPLALEVKVLR